MTTQKANYIEVAERLYRHVNPESKMCTPNGVFITTEKWYNEWCKTNPEVEGDDAFFDWCIENKQSN